MKYNCHEKQDFPIQINQENIIKHKKQFEEILKIEKEIRASIRHGNNRLKKRKEIRDQIQERIKEFEERKQTYMESLKENKFDHFSSNTYNNQLFKHDYTQLNSIFKGNFQNFEDAIENYHYIKIAKKHLLDLKGKINSFYSSSNNKSLKSASNNTSKPKISKSDYSNEDNLFLSRVDAIKNSSLHNINPHSGIYDQRNKLNKNLNCYSVLQNPIFENPCGKLINEKSIIRNDQCVQTNFELTDNLSCSQNRDVIYQPTKRMLKNQEMINKFKNIFEIQNNSTPCSKRENNKRNKATNNILKNHLLDNDYINKLEWLKKKEFIKAEEMKNFSHLYNSRIKKRSSNSDCEYDYTHKMDREKY